MVSILKIYSIVLVSFLLFFTMSDDFSKRERVTTKDFTTYLANP